jgi:tRNA threonylcarbamoyladenosine biosynthesis protein TsaE
MKDVWPLPQVRATQRLGQVLARTCPWSERAARVLYLSGELGAGKTTLAAALLHELGVIEPVRSPSYALLELYAIGERSAAHIDLYRLSAPDELEQLGLRDYLNAQTLLLVEWPERGAGVLPPADLQLHLHTQPQRCASFSAPSDAGRHWLGSLEDPLTEDEN